MSKNFFKKFLLMPVCTQSLQFCLTPCCPMDCSLPGSSVQRILQARIHGVGCHALLQGIFLTQGLKAGPLCLLHWQADSFLLSNQGSPGYAWAFVKLWCRWNVALEALFLSLDFPSSISPLQDTHPHFYYCPPPGLPFSCWPHHLPGCSQTEITQWVCP